MSTPKKRSIKSKSKRSLVKSEVSKSPLDFARLAADMSTLKRYLAGLGDKHLWSSEELATLKDVRHWALRLADEVEETLIVAETENVDD